MKKPQNKEVICLHKPDKWQNATIDLPSSKSISNRVLIIRQLCDQEFNIKGLSRASDTLELINALESNTDIINAGEGGTSYRFLLALLCCLKKDCTLTAEGKMMRRPIAPLVNALRQLGAEINYLEKEGFPPVQIRAAGIQGGKVSIDGSVSSQFISALLMIGPKLKNGLQLNLKSEQVSRPYMQMTLDLMACFGIVYDRHGYAIIIEEQDYIPTDIEIEKDWSAASYFYGWAALSKMKLQLNGLRKQSLQGDAIIAPLMKYLGVATKFTAKGIELSNTGKTRPFLTFDFNDNPDLVPTIAVVCACLRINGRYKGVSHLKHKESDRMHALSTELKKVNCLLEQAGNDWLLSIGKPFPAEVLFSTYNDHRMAMALSLFAAEIPKVYIENLQVVGKSFPGYWDQVKGLGIQLEEK
jgi:3-phosphoshikimate 1-carboxyvinyltransferase